jgi:cytochrome c556
LVSRYNALPEANQKAALTAVWNNGTDYSRSQATTDALATALTEQESIIAGEIETALSAVNTATTTDDMKAAIEGKAAVLGLDMTSYEQLIEARQPSVSVDLVHEGNRGSGYTVETLKPIFDAIVATRHATQASMDHVNNATSVETLGMTWVTDLLAQFKAADEVYDYHSGILLTDKIATLESLVSRYNALPEANQKAALTAVWNDGTDYARSQATTDALAAALTEQESKKASTYSFVFVMPTELIANQEATINVTFANNEPAGDYGYKGVRFKFTKTSGEGDVIFGATDSEGNSYLATNEGYWGPGSGFAIPASYSATTPWKATFKAAETYTFTISLVDAATDNVVADITDTVTITVGEGQA